MNLIAAFVYILTNRAKTVLYTGVTSDLERRLWEHKTHTNSGFTDKYNVDYLVWFREHSDIVSAIASEKKIKNRSHEWKANLIDKENPGWLDLSLKWDGFRDSATAHSLAQNDVSVKGSELTGAFHADAHIKDD